MANIDLEPGLIIHYLDLNPSGYPIVLLLHGLGATGNSWQLQFPPLIEAGYRVLAPDMRGFGQSSYPGGSNNPQKMACDTIKFLQTLGISTSHVVGISMGGTIALQLVLEKPDIVESVILTNTFAKLRPKNPATWIFYAVRIMLFQTLGINEQAKFVASRLFSRPDQEELRIEFTEEVRQADPKAYRSTMLSYARFDLSNRLSEIELPTLIITAEKDQVVPPAVQAEMARNIPHARHVIIPDAGHAVSAEQPDIYNEHILSFLNDIQPQTLFPRALKTNNA